MRRLRWFLGLLVFGLAIWAILYLPLPSLLEWQSEFLKRAFFIMFLCALMCLWRVVRGPSPADRVVALDVFGILILGFCAILGISTGRDWYIDIGIAWALQSFISILALGKYLEGKRFDE
ncbi:MAG: cation:proton antiporter [Candidatus Omnitrophica bacterium]|nr:cation:proton antiporter [Candidatus Omnitrophota bacterium]